MLNGGNPEGTATKFWNIASVSEDSGEITLYGDVLSKRMYDYWKGEWVPGNYITPEGFMEDLELVKNKKNITVKINSCGGDLYTGIAIHNALKGLDATVNVIIEGIAASAASIIAVAGDKVSVYPGSIMMIHGVSVYNYDSMNLQDLRKLEKMMEANEEAIAEIYHNKTGIPVDELRNLMAEEDWMTGKKAVEKGFADEVLEGEEDVSLTMSADKKILMVNGIRHNAEYFRNMPEFPVAKNSAKPAMPIAKNKNPNEGGKHKMTLEELRAQEPDLVAQIESAARNSVDTSAAVAAERERISAIDSIAASIPDQNMVNEAKYGENACTAQELSFRVLQNSARQGTAFLAQLENDSKASGTGAVGAVPNNGAAQTEAEKDAAELHDIINIFNKSKGVK